MKTSTTRTVAQAVAAAMAGTVLSATGVSTAAAGTVNYNAFNQGVAAPWQLVSGGNGTDGWMRTAANGASTPAACQTAGNTCGQGPSTSNNPTKAVAAGNVAVPWAGADPRTDPNFNYTGTQTLNWSATIGAGESVTVSKTDSSSRYGGTKLSNGETFQWADIDTARGAWHDNSETGWAHDTDIGIFKSSVTQQVTLRIASLLPNGTVNETPNYGITVFEGISTLTGNYNHHKAWHTMSPSDASAVGEPGAAGYSPVSGLRINDESTPLPGMMPGSGVVTGSGPFANFVLDDVVGNSATFTVQAGVAYTIYVGGFRAGDWTETRNLYQLQISSAPPKYTLSVSTTATGNGISGSVTSNTGGINCTSGGAGCSAEFNKDASVTLTANPGSGSKLDKWGGDCSSAGSNATCNLTMNASKTATAAFVAAPPTQYKLTVTKPANGTIKGTGIDCGVATNDCDETVNANTQIALTATAASGYQFSSWSGCSSATTSCTVTMSGNKTVSATFASVQPTQYQLTVTKPANGTITGNGIDCGVATNDCEETVNANTQIALTATPASGYQFSSWSGCSSATTSCTVTMNGNKTVSATFAVIPPPDKFALTVARTGNGGVTSSPAGIDCGGTCSFAFDKDTSVTLTATAAEGYTFSGWGGACSGTETCTVKMDAAKDVSANFVSTSPGQFLLSVSNGGNGRITSSPEGIDCGSTCGASFDSDATVSLTATPDEGYQFAGWSGACSGTEACSVTMSEARSVNASFTATSSGPYLLTIDKRGLGSVTSAPGGIDCGGTCSASFDSGALVTLTATPGTGWQFAGWSGACDGASTCTVAMNIARTISATFIQPPRRDFDGDGRADLFWREGETGRNTLWLMLGKSLKASSSVSTKGKAWSIAAVADFDGDQRADVLWRRNRTGQNQLWLMGVDRVKSIVVLPDQAAAYSAARTGDFDRDGKTDVLWASLSTGEVSLWLMNGPALKSAAALPNAPAGYALSEVDDFNGDDQPDVWWFNASTGENSLWLMAGATVQSTVTPPSQTSEWVPVGSGLFNHDLKADVVWRNRTTGVNQIWLMDGGTQTGVAALPDMGHAWTAAGVDDFNHDGQPDIFWRKRGSGQNRLWLMNGTEPGKTAQATALSKGWSTPSH